ncbi:MAG: hypothetical protein US68_C0002G0019 [Candidatus Shapirobacteria bacterium GW2011_GWE1_38_10]|uniref:Membrane protein 6-pyruvoyl-tetrahydropterin synthase-related domain-containing protein n=1 Tax=Candidatus Shapirobacteria bacterium GW2011_GWE1_38_10 TaxID=1618488 RepID=A0A0G0I897_9BACT|nr:MAG: hypothetical protein US46_C0003G0011 [Candidatus Shapirobacteria bacterium GW2011_GWF2_37_20]KKQ50742.1 MAG: hypothetical protein US68_C0002G0019 [Candidatus Shapirobacteria bacterium GW2011_GWE1_38_10]KKQ64492.1 MAG: hypothetical protein US85_C0008G0021 [Candidatus Shapirobacteria bacterium GW2011_GWF1_38_23]HBP51258.1 hypothetical protein [Candidatus Shapirobacteria bacterium]
MAILKKHYLVIFLFILSFFQLKSFYNSFWPRSHDGIYHAIRIKEYFYELTGGQVPVRWANNLDNRYGLPLFNYIYPGPYLLSSLPMFLGFNEISSYKIIIFFAYFLGLTGIYSLYYRQNKYLAAAAALIFGLTPYIFLDIFVRGAFGEFLAIAFMPWAIYGFTYRHRLISVLSLFFVLICHNFLGLIFLLFIIANLIWNASFTRFTLKNIFFSLGLSAFFLIPMIVERKFIISGLTNNFTFDYRQHFLFFPQLIYGKWDYWYSNPGPVDGMSFQLGFANLVIILFSLLSLPFLKKKRLLIFLLISLFFFLILTLSPSQFIWNLITPLQMLQFPWRLLFIPTLVFPLIFFESLFNHSKLKLPSKYLFAIFLIILAMINVRNYRRPMEYIPQEKYQILLNDEGQKSTTSSRDEISPIWSKTVKTNGNRVIDVTRGGEVLVQINSNAMYFDITSQSPVTEITILKNYFPGWKLQNRQNLEEVSIKPDQNGDVLAFLPKGSYVYKYFQTKTEIFSNLISLSIFLLLLLISIKEFVQKKYGKN